MSTENETGRHDSAMEADDQPAGVYEDGLVRIHPDYFNRLLELEREAIDAAMDAEPEEAE